MYKERLALLQAFGGHGVKESKIYWNNDQVQLHQPDQQRTLA